MLQNTNKGDPSTPKPYGAIEVPVWEDGYKFIDTSQLYVHVNVLKTQKPALEFLVTAQALRPITCTDIMVLSFNLCAHPMTQL